jgi:hypothetical protein
MPKSAEKLVPEVGNASCMSKDVELDVGVLLEFGARQVEGRGW